DTEGLNHQSGRRTVDPPDAVAVNRYVFRSVSVIIARYRNVAVRTELRDSDRTIAAVADVPRAFRRTECRHVRLAVAVVVARSQDVSCVAEVHRNNARITALTDVPRVVRTAEYRCVRLSVAVVIARNRNVARHAEL